MKTTKIFAMAIGTLLFTIMFAPVVSAQVPDGWLKVKASFKGMDFYGAGSSHGSVYLSAVM